ncbi:MAG: iron ABC transporter permease [Anaerolineaceae bacterium]|nr:iron ABC transporter permease [Anaerolineaceae bacterium]
MRTHARLYLLGIAALVIAVLLSMGVGSVAIPLREVVEVIWNTLHRTVPSSGITSTYQIILLTLRLPRTILMIMTGAALAGSGCAYQGLFRNPLADPYLIGAASGAGLGAIISLTVSWPASSFSYLIVPMAAFLGALLTVFTVFHLAKVKKTLPVTNLILAGVAVSSFVTALTSFLLINSSGELRRALVWLLGGSTMAGWKPVLGQLPYAIIGLIGLSAFAYKLNVLQFGDEQANQLGVNVKRARTNIIIFATLSTASAVAFTGVIGFVGLIVPHILRRATGGDMRRLLPFSMLGGAVFLVLADVIARVLVAPAELPVGIITSLCGAPFFLFILRRSKEKGW